MRSTPASSVTRRYCSCSRGRYEAHCAERGLVSICPPNDGCPACHYGIVYERAAVFPASVEVAVEAVRQEGARSARPLAPDGSPILFALLVGAEFDGHVPGRIDLSLALPAGLEVGFHVNRAFPRAVAVERMLSGLSHYRHVLAGTTSADFLLALHGTKCSLTCWREDTPAPPGWEGDVLPFPGARWSAPGAPQPWWAHEGTLGELLYPDNGEAS